MIGYTFNHYKVVKKLSNGKYGVVCTECGERYRMTVKQIRNNESPCPCKKLVPIFDKEVDQLKKNISQMDGVKEFYLKTLIMLIDLIPIAEAKYREFSGERTAYALNALISQAREIIHDIKADSQQRNIILKNVQDVIFPIFVDIGQNLIDNSYSLKKRLEPLLKEEHVADANRIIDNHVKELAILLEEAFKSIREQIQL